MVGKLNPQNKTKYMVKHYPNNQNNMSWVEIIQQIELIEINKIIQELEKHLDNISSNSDKYVFGSDIYEIIESYNMKELYIHKNIRKQFDDTIIEKDLSSYINFNIIEINSSDSNSTNIANMFLKNYSGILGIKYY
jgi:hypothetical protein